MIKLENYLIVEKPSDLFANQSLDIIHQNRKSIRLGIGLIHHNGNIDDYPQVYKYSPPYDARCCGEWYRCEDSEKYEIIQTLITTKEKELERLKKLI